MIETFMLCSVYATGQANCAPLNDVNTIEECETTGEAWLAMFSKSKPIAYYCARGVAKEGWNQ